MTYILFVTSVPRLQSAFRHILLLILELLCKRLCQCQLLNSICCKIWVVGICVRCDCFTYWLCATGVYFALWWVVSSM